MMEGMKDPVYIRSPDHRVMYMNPAMVARTGRDATGEFCFRALHDLEERCPWCADEKHQKGAHHEMEVVSPKDHCAFLVSCSPILVDGEESTSKIFVYRDITEFKEMESQLRESQKMEAMGTLAGGIAHDFNNILSVIIGFAELSLDQTPPGGTLTDNMQEILKGGHRAKDLVQQILTFARHTETQYRPFMVKLPASEALKMLRSTLPSSIEFRSYIISDGLVNGDPTEIHQIVMNLCTNAAHAMENVGVLRVTLTDETLTSGDPKGSSPALKPGRYLKLQVSDTGCGMAPDVADRIFEPFFTTKETGGDRHGPFRGARHREEPRRGYSGDERTGEGDHL